MKKSIDDSLESAMETPGALAVALVDTQSGWTIGELGSRAGLEVCVAAMGNAAVVRAKLATVHKLRLNDQIQDILITLGTQYHLICPVGGGSRLFLYYVLDRKKTNLAFARFVIARIAEEMLLK